MQSVHSAFNDRSTASLAVQTLVTHMSTLNARIEKLKVASSKVFGGDETKNIKVEELKEALENTRVSCIAAAREYQCIKVMNFRFPNELIKTFLAF
jgi:ribosomal protein L15E